MFLTSKSICLDLLEGLDAEGSVDKVFPGRPGNQHSVRSSDWACVTGKRQELCAYCGVAD